MRTMYGVQLKRMMKVKGTMRTVGVNKAKDRSGEANGVGWYGLC